MKYFVLLFLTYINFTFAENIYFVNESNAVSEQSSFLMKVNKEKLNLSGRLDSSSIGLEIPSSIDETLKKNFIFSTAYSELMAKMNGFLKIPNEFEDLYKFPAYNVDVTSKLISKEGVFSVIEAKSSIFDTISESKRYKLEKIKLSIDFQLENDILSDRKSYNSVNSDFQSYSSTVFQILTDYGVGSFGASSSTHGTGFFISPKGHALTNLHVLQENKGCIKDKKCNLEIKFKGQEIIKHTVSIDVLTCSKLNDFCLIKVSENDSFEVKHLEIQLDKIPKELFTLGFPGDKTTETENGDETLLTYSFGSPVGFAGRTITSSVFIAGGASGSPFLDLNTKKVVGIVSNGAETFASNHDGAPGVFRPLFLIEREFGLKDYLNGNKGSKIKNLIQSLTNELDSIKSGKIIESYLKEKTYLGYENLVSLAYMHPKQEVRKQIVELLISEFHLNF